MFNGNRFTWPSSSVMMQCVPVNPGSENYTWFLNRLMTLRCKLLKFISYIVLPLIAAYVPGPVGTADANSIPASCCMSV